MNKLKWSLRAITICCTVLPLLFSVFTYQNNLAGLIIPSQIYAAMSGNGQAMQEILPDLSNMSNVKPTYNNDFQFNPQDGTFSLSVNLISPLDIPVTFNSLSLTVTDENGTVLGTLNLGNPVTLVPGENSTIPIEGTLSQELITLLQNSGIDPADPSFNPENVQGIGLDINKIHLTNVNIDIGGIQVHIDELNLNELFESQKSESDQ
ncbi:hypothetical protein MUP77_16170 [Candidatus Bathyarchaeota archaeon]|nr:hypothetical protein [Candidatus Bathyarchaeota archaeon]